MVQGLVRILDETNMPLVGATVKGLWTLPNGMPRTAVGTTNLMGVLRLRVSSTQTGLYELCVTAVQAEGHVYDPDQNRETCDTIPGCSDLRLS
jgi:hypothetical protein